MYYLYVCMYVSDIFYICDIYVCAKISVLVNNAGLGSCGPFHEGGPAEALSVLRVNVQAAVLLTRLLLPAMMMTGADSHPNPNPNLGPEKDSDGDGGLQHTGSQIRMYMYVLWTRHLLNVCMRQRRHALGGPVEASGAFCSLARWRRPAPAPTWPCMPPRRPSCLPSAG